MSGCGCQSGACGAASQPVPGWLGTQDDWNSADPWIKEVLMDAVGVPSFLGALDPAAAVTQVVGSDRQVNSGSKAAILASARAGQMLNASGGPAYIPGTQDCAAISGSGSNNLSLVKAGTGLALTGLQIGLTSAGVAVGAALAPVTFGISSIIGLFTMFSQHHAMAIKKEQSTLCAAVPAANNYLQVIAQAVQSGAATPQDAIHALDSLVSDFQSQVGGIRNDCNAACVMTYELQSIVAVMKSQYQDLADANAGGQIVAPARPNVVSSAGAPSVPGVAPIATPSSYSSFYSGAQPAPAASSALPSWLPIAAVVLGGFFLMREL